MHNKRGVIVIATTGFVVRATVTALLMSSATLHAATVLPATYEVAVAGGSEIYHEPGMYLGTTCSPYNGLCAPSAASASSSRVLTVSGASAGSDYLGAAANSQAQMTYYYQVNGPANIVVPLRISAYMSLSVTGPVSYVLGQVLYGQNSVGKPSGYMFDACASSYLFVCQGANVHLNNSSTTQIERTLTDALYYVSANTAYNVWMRLGGNSGPGEGPGGSYQGYLDPEIVIDPVFLAANPGYSLEFSANMTDGTVVPLPGAGIFGLTGLGAMIGWSRRGRARRSARQTV